jgi:hypothetical protein
LLDGFQSLNLLAGYSNLVRPVAINHAGQIAFYNMRVATPLMTATLVSSANPAVFGQPITLTATVHSIAGPPPNGELVQFKMGTTVIGQAALANGVASLSGVSPSVGRHGFTVIYPGDTIYKLCRSVSLVVVVQR